MWIGVRTPGIVVTGISKSSGSGAPESLRTPSPKVHR